uniref:Uncharacterized protein n=1 Tax=Arundo donax TaxID=35708 RepID=A0A0A8YGL4_ARUDO
MGSKCSVEIQVMHYRENCNARGSRHYAHCCRIRFPHLVLKVNNRWVKFDYQIFMIHS